MENLTMGITITLVGMSVVLAFLTLMIFVMNIVNGFIVNVLNKVFPEKIKEEKTTKKKIAKKSNDEDIAIAIALAHHASVGGK